MNESFANISGSYMDEFKEAMGVVYYIDDKIITNTTSVLY